MTQKIGRYIPAILWIAFLFYLSFLPVDKLHKEEFEEKLHVAEFWHLVIYFALFKLLQFSNAFKNWQILIFCICFSISIETLQYFFVQGQQFKITEIIAAIVSSLLTYYFASKEKVEEEKNIETAKNVFHFKHLDSLRAIGCWYISIAHILIFISNYKLHKIPIEENGFIVQFGHMFISTFFVLSGFLISYFLIKEKIKTNKIDIKRFYIRRAFRILPVYLVGLFVIALIYHLICSHMIKNGLTDGTFGNMCYNLNERFLLYITMLPNVAFCFDRVYFHLSNYWSIGVEEQFYILWPIILLFSKNIFNSLRNIFIIYTVLLIITFAISFGAAETDTSYRIFKLVYITRFAAFAFGGFCAYAVININQFEKTKLYQIVISKYTQFIAFILLIIFSFIKNEFIFAFKHVLIIIPCNAIIIFNMAINKNNLFNIENKFLNYVGMTTYSMYAYNLIFLDMFVGMTKNIFKTNNIIILVIVPLTLLTLVSIASYKYIEIKFLNIRKKYFD